VGSESVQKRVSVWPENDGGGGVWSTEGMGEWAHGADHLCDNHAVPPTSNGISVSIHTSVDLSNEIPNRVV
jgi:hypothetical protein